MSLLLASNSPRRKQLIALGGWIFRVQPADIDETPWPGESPDQYVLRLAQEKARAAASRDGSGDLVVAADTTVADGDLILGKPADARQAVEMLTRLRGRTHKVYTAVAVLRPADGVMRAEVCATEVPMRPYSEAEIQAYVASGDPLDKAGAYAIQHPGFHPAERLAGCYANVVGLPLCHLTRLLRSFGVLPQGEVAQACQATLGYDCPIFSQILEE